MATTYGGKPTEGVLTLEIIFTMSKIHDWYRKQLTENDIVKVKEMTAQKEKTLSHKFLSDEQWIGTAAEIYFRRILLDFQQTTACNFPFEWHWKRDAKDLLDFTIDEYKIDVKCNLINVHPSEKYDVNVNADQLNNENITTYVFFQYQKPTKSLWCVGYIPKLIFQKDSIYYAKGYKKQNGFVTHTDMNDMSVSLLDPIDSLLESILEKNSP